MRQKKMYTKPVDPSKVDASETADARRFRWLLEGNGYFLEEEMLCGHAPCSEMEKAQCRAAIDAEMGGLQ